MFHCYAHWMKLNARKRYTFWSCRSHSCRNISPSVLLYPSPCTCSMSLEVLDHQNGKLDSNAQPNWSKHHQLILAHMGSLAWFPSTAPFLSHDWSKTAKGTIPLKLNQTSIHQLHNRHKFLNLARWKLPCHNPGSYFQTVPTKPSQLSQCFNKWQFLRICRVPLCVIFKIWDLQSARQQLLHIKKDFLPIKLDLCDSSRHVMPAKIGQNCLFDTDFSKVKK